MTNPKRKTRAQRKAFIVAIVSSVFLTGFAIASIFSGIHLPVRDDLHSKYEDNHLDGLVKGLDDSSYIIATHRDDNNIADAGFLYHYDKDEKLIEKHLVFDEIEDKFGVTDLTTIDGMVTSYESDSLFLFSQNNLFRYKGISENDLHLVSYSNNFPGRIIDIACDETDIFVISQDAKQYRIDRFSKDDDTLTPIKSGYVYELNSQGNNFDVKCSKVVRIFSFDVKGDYLYIATGTYIRRINKNLSGSDYRVVYENDYKVIKEAHPELTDDEINQQIVDNHGWVSYNSDTHDLVIPKSSLTANQFAFYLIPDLSGFVAYGDDKFFMVDKQGAFYRYTREELDTTVDVYNYLEELLEYDESFTFPYRLTTKVDVNAFMYDNAGTTAMVIYEESTPMMSVFDMENETLKYTVKVSTRVEKAFYNEHSDTIMYKYSDPVNREAGVSYLSSFVVKDEINSKPIQILFIIFLIITIVSFIVSALSWLCYIFRAVMTKMIQIAKGLKRNWIIYVILFPSIFILCLFCYYPGIAAIFTSFFDYKAGISDIKTWNNFANYIQIFGNAQSLAHFGNMVLFLVTDIVLAIIPPLIFAFFLTVMRHKKLSGIIRTLLFIPGIIPGIAGLLIWRTGIYGDYGLVNSIIKASGGTPILFFQQSDYMNMIWLIAMGFPFVGSYLIFYGAMMNIPSSYYEAAEMDGITVFKRFIKIDIPLCAPQIKYVVIMTIIASIQNFSRVYIAMGGMPGVVSTPIVEMYMLMNASERNYGLASAYATILFVILFFMTYLSMRNKMKEDKHG